MNSCRVALVSAFLVSACLPASFSQDAARQSTQNSSRPQAASVPKTVQSEIQAPVEAPLATQGIVVGRPKIYDNYYLQQQLQLLRSRLESLQVVDQATLLSHIGQAQGANVNQLGVSIQGTGASTPAVTTGSPTSSSPGTITTTSSLAPSNPAPSPTTLTIPSVGQSSLDTLNESMQLAYEIANLELLLNGAKSDQVQADTGLPRETFTVGFPITILPPESHDKRPSDSLAEIQVTICGSPDASIVTLLPKERTYNVASLVDHSLAASLGTVLGGVFSIGGGFLWHHQTYYLVQQQETVALQYATGDCSSNAGSTSFAWQIRPVLGKHYVRPGMEMNFVQLSVPEPLQQPGGTLVTACVKAGWRKSKDNGNRLQPILQAGSTCFNIKYYSTLPEVQAGDVTDIGSGNVLVRSSGTFLDGTRVRIAGKYLPLGSAYISSDQRHLGFSASASEIVTAGGVTVVSREGDELPLLLHVVDTASNNQKPRPSPLKINSVSVIPYSDAQSLITVNFSPPEGEGLPPEPCAPSIGAVAPPPCVPSDPWVVNIGDKLFGLSDSPFFSAKPGEIKLIVSNSVVTASSKIQMRRLLWPEQYYYAEKSLDKTQVAVSKAFVLAPSPELMMAFTGTNLDQARIQYPDCGDCFKDVTPTFATLAISAKNKTGGLDADSVKGLKEVVLCRKDAADAKKCDSRFSPVLAEIPKDESPATKDSKPKLEKHDPVKPGTTEVSISGTNLDQIVAIKAGATTIGFHLSVSDKPALVLTIPSAISNTEGEYPLLIETADKSATAYVLTISSKPKK